MELFFSVGEPSGDQHTASLIHELKRRYPGIKLTGFGGPQMRAAGCRVDFELTTMAVMGVLAVIPLLWKFFKLFRQASRYFRETPPTAVILVDFPGFNWWIARKAKAAGIPVFYYLPPQIWAWASWRVERIRRFVDHVLCALPFEPEWYAERGIQVDYVGHPFFDEVTERKLDNDFLNCHNESTNRIVGVLPGSRNQEVKRNFALMLQVISRLHKQQPHVRFLVACYTEDHRQFCEAQISQLPQQLPIECHVGYTSEIIEVSQCCLMISGSVSLELLARTTPAVVMYRAGWMTYLLGKLLMNCRFMTLPNLMCDREVMPEFPFVMNAERHITKMAQILDSWMEDPSRLEQIVEELTELRDKVASVGAIERAAQLILDRVPSSEDRRQAA